ncbi:hypothetical protein G8770_02745 [Aestuariicella hydrocarbonica]|uniref:Uncharacterized protein n=1 Tax=Pseudomaricurvus hydrocarbonicus TaxID=1470433 RepID=A0A9E5MJ39_9GAMM|nr:hypothetical protein [Aestuariicella hydrocarbonica]NHO64464.1 hypothetical protein [Aestuariicella hydrocarbonica]
MTNNVADVKWLFWLGKQLILAAPYGTFLVIFLTIVAQILQLASFFLPIKIIMLLGQVNIPSYMPNFLQVYSKEHLILGMTILALMCYVGHAVTARFCMSESFKCSKKVADKTNKIILFENQIDFSKNIFSRYVQAISNFCFIFIANVVLVFLYPKLGLSLCFIVFSGLYWAAFIRRSGAGGVDGNTDGVGLYEKVSGIVFLAIFIFIVIDILYFNTDNFVSAILVLILSRQIMSKLGVALRHFSFICKQHEKVDVLFFEGKVLAHKTDGAKHMKSAWILLKEFGIEESCRLVGKEADDDLLVGASFNAEWIDSGENYVVFISVVFTNSAKRYLLKFFQSNALVKAKHEATLLLDSDGVFPCPTLLYVVTLKGVHCHVLDVSDLKHKRGNDLNSSKSALRESLAFTVPPDELLEKYVRSRETLGRRLRNNDFQKLSLVCPVEHRQAFGKFIKSLDVLSQMVINVPLRLHQRIHSEAIYESEDRVILLAHWPTWVFEPLGYDWDVEDISGLSFRFQKVLDLNEEQLASIYYVAALSKLENLYQRNKFNDCFHLINKINTM